MTPDDEIRDRMRRLHAWAEEQPHGLVAPPLPPSEIRRPEPRRPRGVAFAAAAAVVLVAVAGHALGLAQVERAFFSPADDAARQPGAPVSAPATAPAPTPSAPPTTGTAVLVGPSSSASSSPRTTATRPQVSPSRPAGGGASGTLLAVGTVVGLEPLGLPGYRVRHVDLVLRVDKASASGDGAASSFLVRSGLASPGGLSLEAVGRPGYFVTVDGGRVVLRADDGTSAFETSATFLAAPSSAGRGTSFAPFGQRSARLRPVGGVLYARPAAPGSAAEDTAFTVHPGLFTRPVNAERTTGSIIGPADRCVDVWGADNGGPGTPTGIWDCESAAVDQRWSHELDFSLRTLGRCLDVVGVDDGGVGAEVVLWDCEPAAEDQKWVQAPDGTLRSRASGLCLHVLGGVTTNGTRLELATCTGAPDQRFRLT